MTHNWYITSASIGSRTVVPDIRAWHALHPVARFGARVGTKKSSVHDYGFRVARILPKIGREHVLVVAANGLENGRRIHGDRAPRKFRRRPSPPATPRVTAAMPGLCCAAAEAAKTTPAPDRHQDVERQRPENVSRIRQPRARLSRAEPVHRVLEDAERVNAVPDMMTA